MALSIKNDEADRLARELAESAGESLTEAVLNALRERLERITGRKSRPPVRDEIARMQARVSSLPILDERTDDDIVGYDETGLPR